MRVGFLMFGEVLPVMWDARKYVAGGIGLLSYIYPSEDPTDENNDRQQFKQVKPFFCGIAWPDEQDLSADTIAHELKYS